MAGPNNRFYLWVDEKGKRCKLSAPQYIDYVMTYTQRTLNDESIFPTKFDKEFPISFESIVKKIMLLLFHVLAHIYHSHFKEIEILNLHSQTNCIFSHLILFNEQFSLIEEKEVEILADMAIALKLLPPKPNDNPSSDSPPPCSSPKVGKSDTLQETSNVEPIPPHISGVNSSFGDSGDHEQVITTQCRSISPFISNSNEFENYSGDEMVVDGFYPSW